MAELEQSRCGVCGCLISGTADIARLNKIRMELIAELDRLSQLVMAAGEAGCFENWLPAYNQARKAITKANGE